MQAVMDRLQFVSSPNQDASSPTHDWRPVDFEEFAADRLPSLIRYATMGQPGQLGPERLSISAGLLVGRGLVSGDDLRELRLKRHGRHPAAAT